MNYINNNEYGGLLFDEVEVNNVVDILKNKKIFRHSGREETSSDMFEKKLQQHFSVNHALGFNNGTSALKAAFKAVGISQGDRVCISAFTFIATASAVTSLGAIPVPIDFDPVNCMDLDSLEEQLKGGARCVVPVHMQGRAFDLTKLVELCNKYEARVVEDSCQAFAAKNNKFAGRFGDIGVFSFQQQKQVTCGEGGALVTDSAELYDIARNYSDHGAVRDGRPNWDKPGAIMGENLRINNIQSAILLAQLDKIDRIIELQRAAQKTLLEELKELQLESIKYMPSGLVDSGMNILFKISDHETAEKIIELGKEEEILFKYQWHSLYYNFASVIEAGYDLESVNAERCETAEDVSQTLLLLPLPPTIESESLSNIASFISKLHKQGLVS